MKTLTVGELIKKLQGWREEMPVMVGVPNASGDVIAVPVVGADWADTDKGAVISIEVEPKAAADAALRAA